MSARPPTTAADRLVGLDTLRTIAIVHVVLAHGAMTFMPALPGVGGRVVWWLIAANFGVPLFFVLSGFFTAMLWRRRGLRAVIVEAARSKPFLGICMGMQVLFEHSEEGDTACLGIFPGQVLRFPDDAMHDEAGNKLKVPHMGWNNVHHAMPHPLWRGIEEGERFYFVHSYFTQPTNPDLIAGFAHYPFPFTCAVAADNIFAVQFHPEKSQNAGLTLLGNFATWSPQGETAACDMTGAACA